MLYMAYKQIYGVCRFQIYLADALKKYTGGFSQFFPNYFLLYKHIILQKHIILHLTPFLFYPLMILQT